jgi:hypothetical protein
MESSKPSHQPPRVPGTIAVLPSEVGLLPIQKLTPP